MHSPQWVDDPAIIENDFMMDENHAQQTSVRELIYGAKSANKWTVQIVDDIRIEYGDVLGFPDGSKMFVEDYSRPLARGSNNVLEVKGFLI